MYQHIVNTTLGVLILFAIYLAYRANTQEAPTKHDILILKDRNNADVVLRNENGILKISGKVEATNYILVDESADRRGNVSLQNDRGQFLIRAKSDPDHQEQVYYARLAVDKNKHKQDWFYDCTNPPCF